MKQTIHYLKYHSNVLMSKMFVSNVLTKLTGIQSAKNVITSNACSALQTYQKMMPNLQKLLFSSAKTKTPIKFTCAKNAKLIRS